jgi:cell division septation protein DedD
MQDLSRYAKRNHVEISTQYLSLLIVGSVSLIGLVFALGVLVGSRQADNQKCPEPDPLAALDMKSSEPSPPGSIKQVNLSFHESLATRMDQVPTPASLMRDLDEAEPLSDRPAAQYGENEPPIPLETPSREEPPVPEKIVGDEPGSYSLQVGSFEDRQEATVMVRKLEKAGHRAFLVSVNMPERGGRWYRVRVGPFSSKREAWQYKKVFEERERLPAFVVKLARAAG